MGPRPDLHPFPNGWYVFGTSAELASGKVLARRFMGQEVVVFRTESGSVRALDAYCPHLGAHFGYGGTVHGEVLQCPFHGFQFNGQGECVRTGYGTEIPPKARLRSSPISETNGFLIVYHDVESRSPAWQVPEVDLSGWTPLIHRSFVLRDHPQETTENSVDLGHFSYVHNYRNLRSLKEFESDGVYLSTRCGHTCLVPAGRQTCLIQVDFETQIYRLGYSILRSTEAPQNRALSLICRPSNFA